MAKCVICLKDDDQQLLCLREKGSKGINDAAKKRGDKLCTEDGQYVHSKCREVYINEFSIKKPLHRNQFQMTLLRIKLLLVPNSNSCLLLNVCSVDKQLKRTKKVNRGISCSNCGFSKKYSDDM